MANDKTSNRPSPDSPQLPDDVLAILKHIAEQIWAKRASLMVGAGFSRNAEPTSDNAPKMLDWDELAEKFSLDRPIDGDDGKKITDRKYKNPMAMAQEYEAVFGRTALNQVIKTSIPDEQYLPSPLHQQFLELPWTDVFTLNYDTLLEQAAKSIIEQDYEIVVDQAELAFAKKPRIIKLHGSFPSKLPFIITEEDFRTYPQNFGPFVNTVQQSLLENTLILVGFSANDPNFLRWIGWIRDNLGVHAQKIYMIGTGAINKGQLNLLKSRNIEYVSLAISANDNNHKGQLKRFIDEIKKFRTSGMNLDWEVFVKHGNEVHSPKIEFDKVSNKPKEVDLTTQLKDIAEIWQKEREDYPGWVIVPNSLRNDLWMRTQNWIKYSSDLEEFLLSQSGLDYCYELLWRIEKSLYPIYNEHYTYLEKILEKYLTFDGSKNNEKAIYISLVLMRNYRLDGIWEKWNQLNLRLSTKMNADDTNEPEIILLPNANLSKENQAKLWYERCNQALMRLDFENLTECLNQWELIDDLPLFMAKKAMLWHLIGETKQATKLIEQSLEKVCLLQKQSRKDVTYLSLESYILILRQTIQNANLGFTKFEKRQEIWREINNRLRNLKIYECDPWKEIYKVTDKIATTKSSEPYQSI